MQIRSPGSPLPTATHSFYGRAIDLLNGARIPFLVGGAYALRHYTEVERHTKDFDTFLRRKDIRRALKAFAAAGYRAELTFPHWLGKVYSPDGDFVDLIFSSGNGVAVVDNLWFTHATAAVMQDREVSLIPVEEMIWSKSFVMERERFDGADIAHLLRAQGRNLDWKRLVGRFGLHGPILLSHLILFGYVYPAERAVIPRWVMNSLLDQLDQDTETAAARSTCQGTFLSREQYLIDIEDWGYRDPRLAPQGNMTRRQIARWTDAIHEQNHPPRP